MVTSSVGLNLSLQVNGYSVMTVSFQKGSVLNEWKLKI